MKRIVPGLCVLLLVFGLGCIDEDPASRAERLATQKITTEMSRSVGMPGISNFTEKRLLKELYELRDQADLSTYSYTQDMNGHLHFICNSIGYGLPASTQYSNPQAWVHGPVGGSMEKMPQAEPNGLFVPEGLHATFVLCSKGDTGKVDPMYVEQDVIVSLFPLTAADSLQPGVKAP